MTTYTVIPDADIEPDKPIKSSTAFALRDNLIAVVEGDPTAPKINFAALSIGGKGIDGDLNDAASFSVMGFFDFLSMSITAVKTLPVVTVLRVNGNAALSSVITVSTQSRTVATNTSERAQAQAWLNGIMGNAGGEDATQGAGGGSIGAGGDFGANAGGAAIPITAASRPWVLRRPLLGGNGGKQSGGNAGKEWGPGGGAVVLIVEGNIDCTGGEITADGGHTNDQGAGTNQPGGGGGGSILVICTGTITGGTFRARGGKGNDTNGSGGGGGGGLVLLVASAYAGTQTLDVVGGTSGGSAGAAGHSSSATLTADQIRTILQRL